jgi:hypothetical protein
LSLFSGSLTLVYLFLGWRRNVHNAASLQLWNQLLDQSDLSNVHLDESKWSSPNGVASEMNLATNILKEQFHNMGDL